MTRASSPRPKPEGNAASRVAGTVLTMLAIAGAGGSLITGVIVWRAKDKQAGVCWAMLKTSTDAELSSKDRVFQLEQQLADAADQLEALQVAVTQ